MLVGQAALHAFVNSYDQLYVVFQPLVFPWRKIYVMCAMPATRLLPRRVETHISWALPVHVLGTVFVIILAIPVPEARRAWDNIRP